MIRIEQWASALTKFNIAALQKPFAWGVNDCCLYVADVIKAMTGEDLAEDFRGKYGNEIEAMRFLAGLGYRDVEELASSRLPEIVDREHKPAPSLARRGDVVSMADGAGNFFITICDGRTAVGPTKQGINHNPMSAARRAWRVG